MVRLFKYFLPLLAIFFGSCENYFGKRTDLDFIEIPTYEVREISYVPIAPNIHDAQAPVDVHVGYDEFIYVVDSANDQILRYDLALNLQGSINVPGVRKVVQNRSFKLLAIGTYDTTITGVDYSLTALYEIDLVDAQNTLSFTNTVVEVALVHPFYFKNSFSSSDAKVKFTDVAIIGSNLPAENNSYYLSRTGVSNNNAGFGPDYAVLKFTKDHQWISSLPVTATGATYSNYFKRPLALQGFTQAPQLTANNSPDFWVLNQHEDQEIQVQHIQFTEGPFGALYQPIFYSTSDLNSTGYLQTPKRFVDPVDLCLAGDGSRFLFVADAGVDSVYQFTASGLEGVPPPPASTAETNAISTIGGFGNVSAISYYDKILYIADSQTGVVKRFKLTLDFD
jgi:hypothetical protein